MKRINIRSNIVKNDEQNPHFIGAWNLEDDDLCKEIINFLVNIHEIRKFF